VPAGTEIVVTDEATYVETVTLDKRGVTLRSLAGASILAPDASAGYTPHALDIHDCREVTVEGFRVRGGVGGHAVHVRGDVGDISLRRLTISQEPRAIDSATMRFSARGARADRPAILVDGCEISAAKYPCLWIEDQAALVAIQDSVLLPAETAVVAWGTCGSLQMTGCVVRGGLTGVNVVISNWSAVERLQVVNNTFDGVTAWLGIHSLIPEPVEVAIANNLILDGRDVEMSEAVLTDLQRRGVFRGNYWQVPAGLSWLSARMGLIATQLQGDEANIPRDPQDPAYLQPSAGSVLATGGAGGAWLPYVGAVEPTGS
jgi:hypothetical protein